MAARPKSSGTTPQFSFRLDPDLRFILEDLARTEGRTLGNYISRILQEHVDKSDPNILQVIQENKSLKLQRRRMPKKTSSAEYPAGPADADKRAAESKSSTDST